MYFFDLEDYATFFTSPKFTKHFTCYGYYNGKQSWLSDDGETRIIWDNTLTPKCWRLSGDSFSQVQVINTNPAQPPINSNWTVVGLSYNVASNQGQCVSVDELVMNVTKNNPTCTCDGSITIMGSGGVPPYQYSFDNGVTYNNSPFRNNICGGIQLTVMIKDSEGTVKSQLVQIPAQIQAVQYYITPVLISSTVISQTQPKNVVNEFELKVYPPLPNGVTMTVDFVVSGRFARTPAANSAIGTITPLMTKNGTNIPYSLDNTTNTQMANQNSGCQAYSWFVTNYEYKYNNFTITNTDVIRLQTTEYLMGTCQSTPPTINNQLSENDENSIGPLGYAQFASNSYLNCCQYSLIVNEVGYLNGSISNCPCCTIVYLKSLYE